MNVSQVLDSSRIGLMVPVGADESPLPLEQTTVVAQVTGPLNCVAVTQRFSNPFSAPVELEYLFPLPAGAAIVDFELRIGGRTIQGDLQETEQARKAYEEAVDEGKRAGLLEQRRPNLFAVHLGNVKPGDSLLATMRYQERLAYEDGSYAFIFPMGLTPRYHSPEHPEEKQDVDAPIANTGERIGPVEITLSIDASTACGLPTSPSHPIEVTRLDERRFTVRLGAPAIPDHDFVLRYTAAGEQATLAAWRSKGKDADYFLATLLPPALAELPEEPAPHEFIFVLDRSGSMSGGPVGQARNALRACLRTLNPGDRFWLLLFDDQLEWYQPEASPVSQETVDAADAYLAQVEGRGGTEIIAALEAALARPWDESRRRYLVFLTDGAVSAEDRSLEQVRRQIGQARLFTFGIGPSVNRALLTRLAQLGHGAAEFLQLDEDIEGAILRFQDRVTFPVLTDLALQWENGKPWDIYPASLPDLFAGQPLEICGRIKAEKGSPVGLRVSGQAGKEKVQMELVFPVDASPEPAIERAWARMRVDDLLEGGASGKKSPDQVRSEVIGLALEQRLVTPYTAFVAIDHQAAEKGKKPPRTIQVSQPLPAGLDLQGFIGTPGSLSLTSYPPPSAMRRMRPMAPTASHPANRSIFEALPDMPAFLRKARPESTKDKTDSLKRDQAFSPENASPQDRSFDRTVIPPVEPPEIPSGPEEVIRWLARTQDLNGAWNDDIEQTAEALLAFLRNGYTTRAGYFRWQVRRAVDWLIKAQATGTASWTRAVVLAELAQKTGDAAWTQGAVEAAAGLPAPATRVEKALSVRLTQAQDNNLQPLTAVQSLEDLRLAALLNLELPVPERLLKSDLGKVYAACINRK